MMLSFWWRRRRTYAENGYSYACPDVVVDCTEDMEEDCACRSAEGGEGYQPEVDEDEDCG